MSNLPEIVAFSGGQTSGRMLRKLMDENAADFDRRFTVLFCNTGKEHDATLDFVHAVETRWGVPIVWLEYTRVPARSIDPELVPIGRKRFNLLSKQAANLEAHWFRVVDYRTAARRFDVVTPFDVLLGWASALPNVRGRACSGFLKLRTMQRYCQARWTGMRNEYVGIRADEAHRALEIKANNGREDPTRIPHFPLIDAGTVKADVDAFWMAQPFRLNIPNHLGNCDLCFLKSRWKRAAIARTDPRAAQWWAGWEAKFEKRGVTGDGARFIAGKSYEGLMFDASQPELDFGADEPDIPCSCAAGAGRSLPDDDESADDDQLHYHNFPLGQPATA